ncbi:MAG: cupin domain-containing protein [Parasphingorhabdus sp.]|uniref:cupin domain-containing protein n=1 Tax=Parasphingorhabdus sp. TaxID=2709688 RepID=UPI003296C241
MRFSDFDIDNFLQNDWQQQPVFIPNPWDHWRNPLDANLLAGLACEDGVEARLVSGNSDTKWKLEHGPFPEQRFASLGRKDWTLLVQAVDHYVPEVNALIDSFRFIPDWRIDDVMVSYAANGGGVGPHFDHYDVFLVQGAGQRRWSIGEVCDEKTALIPHDDLRLLADYQTVESWICNPGDILYIPPGYAHEGIAIGDECMTYSIGCRAPSRSELIGYWVDDLLAELPEEERFQDPRIRKQHNPGEISALAIDQLHQMITEKLDDREAFAHWFGQYSSTPKYPDLDWSPDEQIDSAGLSDRLNSGGKLFRNPASRFSFIEKSQTQVQLFVDGKQFLCSENSAAFAKNLCHHRMQPIAMEWIHTQDAIQLAVRLFNQGSLDFLPEEESE